MKKYNVPFLLYLSPTEEREKRRKQKKDMCELNDLYICYFMSNISPKHSKSLEDIMKISLQSLLCLSHIYVRTEPKTHRYTTLARMHIRQYSIILFFFLIQGKDPTLNI